MSMLFQTPRIRLRAFTDSDVPLLVDLDSDPRVMTYINGGTPTPESFIREKFLRRVLKYYEENDGLGFWAAEHADSHAFMGWFHLYENAGDPAILEVGYRLKHEFWGQGLATEGATALARYGFDRPDTIKLTALAMTGNSASIGVMKKLGMTFEEQYTHAKGMPVVRYGIDRATFAASNGYNS